MTRVVLPGDNATGTRTAAGGTASRSCREVERLAASMIRFLRGKDVRFSIKLIDLGACGAFQRKVLIAEYSIPRGCVSTYGRIARRVGVPGASRAVGRALATNPFPIVIPCHRAVRSDGSLGGYQGGLVMKRRLLTMEGVRFDNEGKVSSEHMYEFLRKTGVVSRVRVGGRVRKLEPQRARQRKPRGRPRPKPEGGRRSR